MYKGLNVKTVGKFLNFLVKCFSIDESRALHKNYSFWFALLTPAIIALLLGLNLTRELVMHERFDFGFTAVHLDSFIKYYKFPIGLLPISILLSVMVARFHASKQTVQQTHLKNYFEHFSFFESFCNDFEKKHNVNINVRALYLNFYNKSNINHFSPVPSDDLIHSYVYTLQLLSDEIECNSDLDSVEIATYKDHIPDFEGDFSLITLDKDESNTYYWAYEMKNLVNEFYSFPGNRITASKYMEIENKLTQSFTNLTRSLAQNFPTVDLGSLLFFDIKD